MIVKNKLDKIFGPFGSSTGFFLLLGGLAATYYSLIGLFLVLIGAFVSLTSTSTTIDTDKRRIKFSNNLFGIIPIGKWIDINPDMRLGLKKSHMGFRAYSRSNMPLDYHVHDFRILLYGSDNKQIMTVNKFTSYEASKSELNNLSNLLGLDTI